VTEGSPTPTPVERLRSLNIDLPALAPAAGTYIPGVVVGNLLFLSGQTPTVHGRPTVVGRVDSEVSVAEARTAAHLAALNCLAEAVATVGSLNRVRRIVRLTGYVRSQSGFSQQPAVVDGASQLLNDLWGEMGRHSRASIGVAELPGGAPVEIEMVMEIVP
jgi:enamine deaminase RidA (YjgF/YER057c/UK114 family)